MPTRRLSSFLPRALQPSARALGRERVRAAFAVRQAALEPQVARGRWVSHLHGPPEIRLGPTDLVVVCLIRNGAAHLSTFIAHYQRLGASHIVLVDNGSTDDTVERATAYDGVTVFRTTLPFRHYEAALKRWLAKRYGGAGGWVLIADMDELFDYPFARCLTLGAFLEYLDRHGYDAVTAQHLEMIPRESIAELQGRVIENLEETHRHYDLSDIRRVRDQYWLAQNELDADGHYTHTGGIWETIFGYEGSKLTKQPLLRPARGLTVFPHDVHFRTGARIAAVTRVCRHYKYTGRFVQHVHDELRRRQHYGNAEIFAYYRRVLDENPNLSLFRATSREYGRAEDLLESGFPIASARYRQWVRERGRTPAPEVSGR